MARSARKATGSDFTVLSLVDAATASRNASSVSVGALLTPAHLMARAARINDNSVMANPRRDACGASDRPPEPSTSQVSVVDSWGDALAMTTTINVIFGYWLSVGGFFLNDAMTNFSFAAPKHCSANAPSGGKRPETAMAVRNPFCGRGCHGHRLRAE